MNNLYKISYDRSEKIYIVASNYSDAESKFEKWYRNNYSWGLSKIESITLIAENIII